MELPRELDVSKSFDVKQLVEDRCFDEQNLTREQVVDNYLSKLGGMERENASTLAAEFQHKDKPLANTVVLIPIAAHQEAHNIQNAIAQYANQQTSQPFSILLYLNAPHDADRQSIDATLIELEKAKKDHTNLDLRVSSPELYANPKIGTIRRRLWNAALLLAHVEGAFDNPNNDVIGINHDIDVVRQSPRNISRIQSFTSRVQQYYEILNLPSAISRPHATYVKHAHDTQHPSAAKGVFWYDFSYRQLRPRGSYDAGLVIPFSYYANKGGVEADKTTYEMRPFTAGNALFMIPRTFLETSPRRFLQRMHDTTSFSQIWTEGTFGPHDTCRTEWIPDITEHRLDIIIRHSLYNSMDNFFHNPIEIFRDRFDAEVDWKSANQISFIDEFAASLERKKSLAKTVLLRVLDMPVPADLVEQRFNTHILAEKMFARFNINDRS